MDEILIHQSMASVMKIYIIKLYCTSDKCISIPINNKVYCHPLCIFLTGIFKYINKT